MFRSILSGSRFDSRHYAPAGQQEAYPFAHRQARRAGGRVGSTTDTIARIVAEQLSRRWGKNLSLLRTSAAGAMIIGRERKFFARRLTGTRCWSAHLLPSRSAIFSIGISLMTPTQVSCRSPLLAKVSNALGGTKGFSGGQCPRADRLRQGQSPARFTFGSQGAGSTAHLSARPAGNIGRREDGAHSLSRRRPGASNDVIAGHIDMFLRYADNVRAGCIGSIGCGIPCRRQSSALPPPCPRSRPSPMSGLAWVPIDHVGSPWWAPPDTPMDIVEKINRDCRR